MILFVMNSSAGTFAGVLVPTSIDRERDCYHPTNLGIDVSVLSGVQTTCTFSSFATFVVTGVLAPTPFHPLADIRTSLGGRIFGHIADSCRHPRRA
jgi:hypothetical protein